MSDRKIIDRIRKVLAKAEGTDNPAEAEMLMAKVEAMLEEHNFTLLDVAKADAEDPIGTTKNAAHCWVSNSWQRHVATQLANLYGCRLVSMKIKNKYLFSVSGRESGRITWELMLPFVIAQVRAEAKAMQATCGKSPSVLEREVGNALTYRIAGLANAASDRDAARVSRGERALVPVDLVQAELDAAWGSLRTGRARHLGTSHEALDAAKRVSLHRQTESGSSTLAIS